MSISTRRRVGSSRVIVITVIRRRLDKPRATKERDISIGEAGDVFMVIYTASALKPVFWKIVRRRKIL